MGEIFQQLGHLFLQTIPTVIFVFVLFFVLDRIFFRPLTAVLEQRDEATRGALARARDQVAEAHKRAEKYEAGFQVARQEVYRQHEAERRVSLADREAALKKSRDQAEVMIREAQAKLAEELARAKGELEAACHPLAEEIYQNLVGSASPTGGAGGTQP